MSDRLFIPADPQKLVFRPLNKGMFLHLPAESIPDEAVVMARNARVEPAGITRRDGYTSYAASVATAAIARPLYVFAPAWKTDGTQFNALLTDKYLYAVGLGSMTVKYWNYSTGKVTCSTGSTAVQGQGTAWTSPASWLRVGDRMLISTAGSAGIAAINSAASLTLDATIGTFAASTAYTIRRAFIHSDPWSYDTTVINNTLVISDRSRPLYVYNGTLLSNYTASPYRPGCVEFFKERLLIGNTVESTGPGTTTDNRQRIRWSGVTGNPRSFDAADYLDLPYSPGILLRILGMGHYPILYFEDAIYYGLATSDPNLPYAFHRIETANIGLAGPHAVARGPGGHYFVGPDDIYFLPMADPTSGPQPIGTPVIAETIETCSNKYRIYAASDPARHRIVFGFPTTGDNIAKIWSFDVRSKAWSYEDTDADMLANPLLKLNLTIDDLSGTIDDLDNTYASIDSMTAAARVNDLFIGQNGTLYTVTDGATVDPWGTPALEIITGDKDFGDPGLDKRLMEMRMRLAAVPSAELTFQVSASSDGGVNWTSLGNMTIGTDEREGRLTFEYTGALVRFRLLCTTAAESYTVTSIQLKVSSGGESV